MLKETSSLVTRKPLEATACRDPDDDIVLAMARAGESVAIVTGDQDLLILDPFQGIRLLMPSAFWKWESEADDAWLDPGLAGPSALRIGNSSR